MRLQFLRFTIGILLIVLRISMGAICLDRNSFKINSTQYKSMQMKFSITNYLHDLFFEIYYDKAFI